MYLNAMHLPRVVATGPHAVWPEVRSLISGNLTLNPHARAALQVARGHDLGSTRGDSGSKALSFCPGVCTKSRMHTIPYAHATPWLIHIRCTLLDLSSVQAVDPVHAFKLTGMLLDAHMNLMTIDIVRLLFSPKMVRLSLAQQPPRGRTLASCSSRSLRARCRS